MWCSHMRMQVWTAYVYVSVMWGGYMCYGTQAEVRGQLMKVGSFLPPCGSCSRPINIFLQKTKKRISVWAKRLSLQRQCFQSLEIEEQLCKLIWHCSLLVGHLFIEYILEPWPQKAYRLVNCQLVLPSRGANHMNEEIIQNVISLLLWRTINWIL